MSGFRGLFDRYGGAALVTGASSGLGEVYARRLARAGFDLVLVARRRDRLEKLARALEARHGVRCVVLAEDLSAPGAVARMFDAIMDQGIDVGMVVNNAGFGSHGDLVESDLGDQASMVDLNCRAVLEVAHRGASILKKRGRGAMIIVSSITAFFGLPKMATYAATKAFDMILAEALWAELRPHGVDVQALCPGPTDTEFHELAHSPTRTGLRMMSCAEVVDVSLRRLGRSPVVVPGVRNSLVAWKLRVMPLWMRIRFLALAVRFGV